MLDRLTTKAREGVLLVGLFLAFPAGALLFAPTTAFAHGISVFAHTEGDAVVVEGSFHDGAKCKDCAVEAFDSQGQKIAEGQTDAKGRYSFGIPAKTDILIRLRDSVGHMAEYKVPATDLPDTPQPPRISNKADEHPHVQPHSESAGGASGAPRDEHVHDSAEVEQALARQLAPIRRQLEESRRRRRFSDVVGGIGYIVGLMGLILYFMSKRRK